MKYKRVVCEWNLLFWTLAFAYFREKKDFSFDELADPVEKMAIKKQINKIIQLWTQNINENGLHKQIIATTKITHLRSN